MKLITAISILFAVSTLVAQQNPGFRGEGRSGHYNETGLLKRWPGSGPALLLQIEGIGKGFSQAIFTGEMLFVTGIKEDTIDILSAYNLEGKLLWDVPYGRSWTASYIDSRSTPTWCDGKVYVSSGTGQLSCVDAQTGKIVWQVDAVKKYNGEIYKHGDAESPLVVDNLVAYTVGGEKCTLVAFDKDTGREVWQSKSLGGAKSYASPSLIEHNSRKIILAQTTDNLIGIDPADGTILWSYNLIQYHLKSQGVGAQTNPPLYHNGEIFVTSGYDHPGLMFSLSEDGNSIQLKWRNDVLDAHHGGVVCVDGIIYGSTWKNNANGNWAAIDWETGKTLWENEWENKGSVICADGRLYLYEEKRGNLALVEPSAEKLKIISSFKPEGGTGPHWAHPAIYDKKLFVRHGDVLMIFDIGEN